MKKNLWIAAAGALVLAGCQSSNVMDERNYSDPKPEEVTQLPPPKEPVATVLHPQTLTYEPMTDATPTGGVDSVAGAALPGKTSTYVVRKGDTLGGIAKQHGVKLSALMAVNNMDANSAKKLRIGQKLTIPGAGAAVKSSAQATAGSTALNKDGLYEIQSGDTIGSIAHRFKVKSAAILKANNMTEADSRRLQVGQKIVIPDKSPSTAVAPVKAAPVAVADTQKVVPESPVVPAANVEVAPSVDLSTARVVEVTEESISLADFAKKHGADPELVRKANQNYDSIVYKGDPVFIPSAK